MAFGVKWHQGTRGEFALIDAAYNTAGAAVLTDLRGRLDRWRVDDPGRPTVMDMQAATVFDHLGARLKGPDVELPPSVATWVAATNPADIDAHLADKFQLIHESWFSRANATQWIYDARLTPPEVEAVMVEAKLQLCDLLLSPDVDTCRWQGQCEWPEFLVRLAVDKPNRRVDIFVFGPDNRMPRDQARNTGDLAQELLNAGYQSAPPLPGRLTAHGRAVSHTYVGRIPTADQEVPYLPDGPLRMITEVRWQPAPAQPQEGGASLLDLRGPIAGDTHQDLEADSPLGAELDRVQGNILKSHGRTHAAHLLLRFGSVGGARSFLRQVNVTTARQQWNQAVAFRRTGGIGTASDPAFRGLGLSAAGYRFLGIQGASGGLLPADAVFRKGMKQTGRLTFDAPVDQWQGGLQGDIHAVLVLAHSHDVLDDLVAEERRLCRGFGIEVVAEERGHALRQGGRAYEPFGFVDNLNQPCFFQQDVAEQQAAAGDGFDVAFAPSQVLVAHEDRDGGLLGYGSYLVFRKLEQNVARFQQVQDALAAHLGVAAGQAGAQLVGRRADGTRLPEPLPGPPSQAVATHEEATAALLDAPPGSGCPYSAHIRRVGDRTSRGRARVMARRGIPYDERTGYQPGPATQGVGLLFMACMWDIAEQFVEVQAGAVAPDDPGSPDLLLGHGATWWADPSGGRRSLDLGAEPLVRFLGGEYFHLPPPETLRRLADPPAG